MEWLESRRPHRYAVALASVGAVLLLRSQIEPAWVVESLLVLHGAAILVSAWFGGLGPGLLATLAATLSIHFEIAGDSSRFATDALPLTLLFAVEGLIITTIAALRRRAERVVREHARQHEAVAELGRRSLEGESLAGLCAHAAASIVERLRVDYVEVLEQGLGDPIVRGSASGTVPRRPPDTRVLDAVPEDLGPMSLIPEAASWLRALGRGRGRARAGADALIEGVRMAIPGAEGSYGAIGVYTRRPRRFSTTDIHYLRSIANVLASSIRRFRAEVEAGRMRRRDAALAELSATLAAPLDAEARVRELVRLAVPVLGDWCSVDLMEGDSLVRVAVAGDAPAASTEDAVFAAARAGATQRPVNGVAEPGLDEKGAHHASPDYVCVPLRARGRTLGVLSLGTRGSRGRYLPEDVALAEEVASRAAVALDNSRLYEEALASDRSKDEFLSVLAHELRNPLAPMVHALETLRIAGDESEARRRAQSVLSRQLTHLNRVVRDLLDIARITRGTIALKQEPVDLGAAIASAVDSCQTLARAHRHQLTLELLEHELWLSADPIRLEQVFVNLITNAIQYSPEGASTRVSVERTGDHARIRVVDHGVGIAPESLPEVFDLFRRPTPSGSRGTGVGLYLARRLVELHDGTIEAHSEGLGKGSQFLIVLPLISAPVRSERDASESHTVAPPGLRVLVVDDHMDAATALGELLGLWGFEARTATDGRHALAAAREFDPDVVLLDLGMPGMDGYAVARALRRDPATRDVVLVALTGFAHERARERVRAAGFDGHFVKPVDLQVLRSFLESSVRRAPARFG